MKKPMQTTFAESLVRAAFNQTIGSKDIAAEFDIETHRLGLTHVNTHPFAEANNNSGVASRWR